MPNQVRLRLQGKSANSAGFEISGEANSPHCSSYIFEWGLCAALNIIPLSTLFANDISAIVADGQLNLMHQQQCGTTITVERR